MLLHRFFMMHFTASTHFTCHLWDILLRMTSATPLLAPCKSVPPPATYWRLGHQICPSGRERRKVKSPCSECADLRTLWPVHTWLSVCVTVCDSKGLTKECMKSAGTSDNWAICCKVAAEQPTPHPPNPSPTALTTATEWGFCNSSTCVCLDFFCSFLCFNLWSIFAEYPSIHLSVANNRNTRIGNIDVSLVKRCQEILT